MKLHDEYSKSLSKSLLHLVDEKYDGANGALDDNIHSNDPVAEPKLIG